MVISGQVLLTGTDYTIVHVRDCEFYWEFDREFYFNRDAGDGLSVVKFSVQAHVDLFGDKEGIFYKYVVFSQRMHEVGHPYEYLHGASRGGQGGFNNRALKIPKDKRIPGGQLVCACTM